MSRPISAKMFLREHSRSYVQGAPALFMEHIEAPPLDTQQRLSGTCDYLHLFVRSQADVAASFPRFADHLAESGVLWVSWPKARQRGTDLNLHEVIRIGYANGLVESTCLSIDSTWSALRFTHPKPGKQYNNSHADLTPRQRSDR